MRLALIVIPPSMDIARPHRRLPLLARDCVSREGVSLVGGFCMRPDPNATLPPEPPVVTPRLVLTRKQYFGIPLLAVIPALTLLGVFGEQREATRATSRSLEMRVVYPSRFRYRQIQSLDITLRNVSGRTLDTVTVSLDTAYIARFSSVRIDPEPKTAFVIAMTNVKPQEARLVHAELWGERYGSHRAEIIGAASADTVRQQIHTFVFP
jgi:hypothetical protein